MVIWDCKNLHLELAVGEVPGTLFSKGWIKQELFDFGAAHFLFILIPPIGWTLFTLMHTNYTVCC